MEQPLLTVRLKIEQRQNSYYVSSDDMPGLWLWGPDPEKVFHDVPIAVKELYTYREGVEVIVKKQGGGERLASQYGVEKLSDIYEIYPVSSSERQDRLNGR